LAQVSKQTDEIREWLAAAPDMGVVIIAAIPVVLALFGLLGGGSPAPAAVEVISQGDGDGNGGR
jgi:hypothetical protein